MFELLSNMKFLCMSEKIAIAYHKGYLYTLSRDQPKEIIQKLKIGDKFSSFGLCERAMRLGPRCGVFLDDDHVLISIDGKILNYSISINCCKVEHIYNRGMKNPLAFCMTCLPNGKKEVYYGEYIWNNNHDSVAIYRRKNNIWECVYEFLPNTITHIHNIIFDDNNNRFFILTGDKDKESGIWLADREFKTVTPLLLGKQSYRACVAFVTEKGLIYATDTPLEDNFLYEVNLKGDICVSVKKLHRMPGSCIYGTETDDSYYFSTTVEPDSTLPTWYYRTTYRLGKGISDRYSHIIRVRKTGEIKDIYREKKDILPMWLFQFGNIQFPGSYLESLYFTGQSLRHINGKTIMVTDMEKKQ